MPPYQTTERAHDKRQGKYSEGSQQPCGGVGLREERQGDDRRQIAISGVVEPLDKVAHKAGRGGAAQRLALAEALDLLFGGQG